MDTPTMILSVPRGADLYVWGPIRGEDVRLVRPYVIAHEQQMHRRAESGRCADLMCAPERMAVTW
ncbi:hypothetical protein [Streptomyces sp. NPDC054765]